MKEKDIICCICKEHVEKQEYAEPTWFGSYMGEYLIKAICKSCYDENGGWGKHREITDADRKGAILMKSGIAS